MSECDPALLLQTVEYGLQDDFVGQVDGEGVGLRGPDQLHPHRHPYRESWKKGNKGEIKALVNNYADLFG